ncbi:hypothetical protein PRIPAC_75339 [Pristionchus pacificus]|uniref:Uncharacterized protein n=1 Tax=Pristionchus pacificus TaxID=54126 RepID=A0A2A6BEM8_PRIPA|nr:hypothetical protein PRIPAC_75339 [Pristionchus pacificus]|eukprot:PDM64313.1 hypothetical protein PRIPAC_52569 [Pristionchus pacificus]
MASPSKLRRSVRTSKKIVRLSINDAVLKKPAAKRKTVVGTTKTPAPPVPSRKTTVGSKAAPTAKTVATPSKIVTSAVRVTTKGADEEKSEKEKTVKGPPNNAARRATRTAKKDEKKEDEKKAAPTTVRLGPIKAYPDEPKMAAAAAAATAAGDNGEPEGYKVLVNLGVMRDLCKANFVYPDRRMVEIIVDKKNVNLLG